MFSTMRTLINSFDFDHIDGMIFYERLLCGQQNEAIRRKGERASSSWQLRRQGRHHFGSVEIAKNAIAVDRHFGDKSLEEMHDLPRAGVAGEL